MAEEKKTPAKTEEGWLTKVLNWFKALPGRIAKPFKNMVAELKKVTWPSKKKWISSSVAVLVFMLFMGVVIGLLDLGATALVNTMIPSHNEAVTEEVGDTAEGADSTETEATEVSETEATEAPETEATEAPTEAPAE